MDNRLNTKEECERLTLLHSYYNNRWEYYSIVMEMIKRKGYNGKVLELGSMHYPIFTDSHTIDIEPEFSPYYLLDASIVPWPIADKSYGLFIGLQVLEHLNGKQKEVFAEVKRTCKNAIISLPYMWNCPGDCHHGINEAVIHGWTGLEPTEGIRVGTRIINNYEF